MRPCAALFLAALLAASCAPARTPPATPAGPIVLAVVTWNMDAGRGDLPRLLSDLSSGRLTEGPTGEFVLLLQEAIEGGERDVATFASALNLSVHFSPVRTSRERTSGNAILSTVPLLSPYVISLPRQRQARAAVVATVEVAGAQLFLVSAHLENRISWLRGGLFSESARARQAEALLRTLPRDAPGIAGGDLNTWLGPNEPAWRAFAERFPDTPTDRAAPTFRDRLVLDHLFFDLPDGWVAARRVLPDRYGSDHHPVLGVIGTSR